MDERRKEEKKETNFASDEFGFGVGLWGNGVCHMDVCEFARRRHMGVGISSFYASNGMCVGMTMMNL